MPALFKDDVALAKLQSLLLKYDGEQRHACCRFSYFSNATFVSILAAGSALLTIVYFMSCGHVVRSITGGQNNTLQVGVQAFSEHVSRFLKDGALDGWLQTNESISDLLITTEVSRLLFDSITYMPANLSRGFF